MSDNYYNTFKDDYYLLQVKEAFVVKDMLNNETNKKKFQQEMLSFYPLDFYPNHISTEDRYKFLKIDPEMNIKELQKCLLCLRMPMQKEKDEILFKYCSESKEEDYIKLYTLRVSEDMDLKVLESMIRSELDDYLQLCALVVNNLHQRIIHVTMARNRFRTMRQQFESMQQITNLLQTKDVYSILQYIGYDAIIEQMEDKTNGKTFQELTQEFCLSDECEKVMVACDTNYGIKMRYKSRIPLYLRESSSSRSFCNGF